MSLISKIFIGSALIFTFIYLLRGMGILSFIPGGSILVLLFITISAGLTWGIMATLRY